MIPDEAVEALAVRNFNADFLLDWSQAPNSLQESFLSEARKQCAVVEPYFLGQDPTE